MKGVRVVLQDNYVKISYSQNSTRKRFPTGVKLESPDQLSNSGKLKGIIADKEKKQQEIDRLKLQIETAVQSYLNEFGSFPSVGELEQILKSKKQSVNRTDRLLDAYEIFYKDKKNEFGNSDTKTIQSLNSHRALKYYLEGYQIYTGNPIYLYEINKSWMFDFKRFNESKRENTRDKKYKTFGGLRGNTIRKKVGIFISFMKWSSQKGFCKFPEEILGFSKEIAMPPVIKATVTKNEVTKLYSLHLTNSSTEFVRDLFVFTCLTGLRWSDLMTLNKKHLVKYDQGIAIVKMAQKTKDKFTVFLNDISYSILEKYDFSLKRMSNPAYNRELKKFLKKTGLFNDSTDFFEDGRYLERWETISIHRGRDSFITMLLSENVPTNAIMQYTGHKKLRTLESYIDKNTTVPNHSNKLID